MYLKRLELQGFKSFPEKIRLEFNKGITAVVGPNGSGKSNISDAVRWVLGEQSAKSLRGAKMEDIIFSGTENRRPLGFAEVSMVIDNADAKLAIGFLEVKITRRVYRSGESEYQINGTTCRLKDIHEMFMDTGVGREGYSIIGQGRIEEILSTRSEDRRFLFEEAVGIVKYKNRKQEAQTRLERERQNLVRVNDIILELETQLAPLEEQSAKAKEYLALKERLKLLQIHLFLLESKRLEEEHKNITLNSQHVGEQIQSEKEKQSELQRSVEKVKEQSITTDLQIKEANHRLAESRSALEQKENDIKFTKEQINHVMMEMKRLSQEIDKKNDGIRSLENAKSLDESKHTGIELELLSRKAALALKQADFDVLSDKMNESEVQIERFNVEIIEAIKTTTEVNANISRTKGLYEQLEQRKEQISDERNYNESQINEKTIKIQANKKSIEEIDSVTERIAEQQADYGNKKVSMVQEIQSMTSELERVSKRRNETTSRYKVLSELENNYEGYYKSVKSVLKQKKSNPERFSGVCGAVGELMETDERYEVAMEIALGGAMQNIITKTENDARDAIEYLKSVKEGRATFLPLTAIKPKDLGHVKGEILKEKGVLGIAKDLVAYDGMYENIFANLLGKVIIVDHIENGLALFKKYNYVYKIVTQEGELLNPGGSLTGGSINQKSSHIVGRGREIKELKHEMDALASRHEILSAESAKLNDQLRVLIERIDENKNVLQQKALDRVSFSQTCLQSESILEELMQKKQELVMEDAQLMEQLVEANKTIRKYEDELAKLEKEIDVMHDGLEQFQSNMSLNRGQKEDKIKELTDMKVDISGREQNLEAVKDNINRIRHEIHHAQGEIDGFKEDIRQKNEEKIVKEEGINNIEKEMDTLKDKQMTLTEALVKLDDLKEDILDTLQRLEGEERKSLELVGKLDIELTRLELKREQVETERLRLHDQMWDEYKITFQMAMEYPKIDVTAEGVKKEERQIKVSIQEMGDIYVSAIEEYKHVKDRYETMSKQRDDILEAEEKLNVLIQELIKMMEDQFREQFAIISENFSIVFNEMFGGGNAYLRLADEKNILESGIDIIAQPPGKTLQSMSLLSGGERALTATALLFGILRMKPSPFCILDEVEAALDDANVNKYADYLKKFSGDTQFILITHRKGTMEAADVLYGVTMQEQGVSKLVSVDFTEVAV